MIRHKVRQIPEKSAEKAAAKITFTSHKLRSVMMAQNEYDIEGVLGQCSRAASDGYRIASEHTAYLKETLSDAGKEVQAALDDFRNSPIYEAGVTDELGAQLKDIKSRFGMLSDAFSDSLRDLRQNMSKFSITLFGRTMAGKSTLMEILTHGDGRTIGKGAQRTTRDIRKYPWNSLEITDVPGIGAFEGKEDEDRAFEAARSADLILFLITDDAPQKKEAECFGRIKSLGKPVICIMNVKSAINDDMEISLLKLKRQFDTQRLDEIKEEFLGYAKNQGQEWRGSQFVYVHLLAAFTAQSGKLDRKTAETLRRASRIDYLKKQIIYRIREKGEFYSLKKFIDAITVPVLDCEEILLKQYCSTSAKGRILAAKQRGLSEWRKKFKEDGEGRIDSTLLKIRSRLNSEVASFAEEHFDDNNATRAWKERLKELKVEQTCQETLKSLEEQANDKAREIAREIGSELKFSEGINDDISLSVSKITDGRRAWNWGLTILGGGLSIAAIVGGLSLTPFGWIVAGASFTLLGFLGSWLFDSRGEQEARARRALENQLSRNVEKMCEKLRSKMMMGLSQIVQDKITALSDELYRRAEAVFKLADTQKSLAWKLNGRLLELNMRIVKEAIRQSGAAGLEWWVEEAARIPGSIVLIRMADGRKLPDEQRMTLHSLMSEFVRTVFYSDSKWSYVSRIMGRTVERSQIHIEEKIGVAHVPVNNSDTDMVNRARLAQQLTRLVITK